MLGGKGLLIEEFHHDHLVLEVLLVEPLVSPIVMLVGPVLEGSRKAKLWCILSPVTHDHPPGLRFR